MSLIILKEHIGEWLVPTIRNYADDKNIYQITSGSTLLVYHTGENINSPHTINYHRSYDNSAGYYKLISDEEAQKILRNRKLPGPYEHVIKKIREMKARRERMGYDY